MNADAKSFRNEGIRTTTEDTQPHLVDNTAACSLDYSELLGIIKQIQKSTSEQTTLTHEQSENLENNLSELVTKLDDITVTGDGGVAIRIDIQHQGKRESS